MIPILSYMVSVKTHKKAGEVRARLLHSSTSHMCRGISSAAAAILNPFLKEVSHVCVDTADFLSKLRSRRYPPKSILIKADVKDFYMSGQHEALLSSAMSVYHGEKGLKR